MRLEFDGLHDAAVLGRIFADVFHPQRGLAAVHDSVIGKGSHAFIVLKSPAGEVVAGRVLKIAVCDLGRVIGLKGQFAALRDKQRVLSRQPLHIVVIMPAAHDHGDQAQPVLFRRLPERGSFGGRDIIAENHRVVPVALARGKSPITRSTSLGSFMLRQ